MIISLIVPLKNEENSIEALFHSIENQNVKPSEIILVDGGSLDKTIQSVSTLIKNNAAYKLIMVDNAMPGEARNIGIEHSCSEWIAFTDAGIKLQKNWLERLITKAEENAEASIIYGNYHPTIKTGFEKWAAIAYVPPLKKGKIRGKFIASSLIKKEVWEKAGGFPKCRAAEDLMFMERAEQLGYKVAYAPEANVYWQLRPNFVATFKRFDLYSKYNVWAHRQKHWHYGVVRQYAGMAFFLLLGILHHWVWFLMIPVWIIARTAKRIFIHRYEFGLKELFNPLTVIGVLLIILAIDVATFSGWIKALIYKPISKKNK